MPVHYHGHSIFYQQIARKQHFGFGEPYQQIAGGVCRTGMTDYQRLATQPQRVGTGNRAVRGVGKLEVTHRIQPDQPNPIGHEGIFSAFGGQHSSVRMRDDPGSQPPEYNGAEMVIRMVMSQHQPSDRLPGSPANGLYQLVPLLRAGECVDYNDTVTGNDKAGVGPALRAPAGITDGRVDPWSETANGGCGMLMIERAGEQSGQNDNWKSWEGQAEPKLM